MEVQRSLLCNLSWTFGAKQEIAWISVPHFRVFLACARWRCGWKKKVLLSGGLESTMQCLLLGNNSARELRYRFSGKPLSDKKKVDIGYPMYAIWMGNHAVSIIRK